MLAQLTIQQERFARHAQSANNLMQVEASVMIVEQAGSAMGVNVSAVRLVNNLMLITVTVIRAWSSVGVGTAIRQWMRAENVPRARNRT